MKPENETTARPTESAGTESPRALKADAGLYRHHCGMKPYRDAAGTIRESYQALNERGEAIATLSMVGGELEDHCTVTPPTPLHRVALEAWAAQIGEDYAARETENTHAGMESPRPEIIEHAARALFANAWADYQERAPDGVNLSGCEILDCMPEVPAEAITAAEKLVAGTEALNGETITASLARAQALPDDSADRPCNAEYFGHYLAMQALGTGVGLESVCDRKALALKLPYCEFSYLDYPYFPED